MIRVLIIDDSDVIRHMLGEYLTDLGCTVDVARDGVEGTRKALGDDFAAVFCDIHMPRKNGYQVFREVSVEKPNMLFILTDSLPGLLADMARQEGAHRCLVKPFDLEQVREALQPLLAPEKST